MNILRILIKLQNMPLEDKLNHNKFNNLFSKILLKKGIDLNFISNFSNNFLYITNENFPDNFIVTTRGPRVTEPIITGQMTIEPSSVTNFKHKFKNQFQNYSFIFKDGYIFAEEKIHYNIVLVESLYETIKCFSWSCNIKITDDLFACRPIDFISIETINKYTNVHNFYTGIYKDLIFQKQDFFPILSIDDKKQNIVNELNKYNCNKNYVYDYLLNKFDNPKIHCVEFEPQYLIIPSEIIEYFILNEQLGVLLYENNEPINKFLILLEHNYVVNSDGFSFSANAKLLDLLQVFNRDKQITISDYKKQRDQFVISKEIGTMKEKIYRMQEIGKKLDINECLENYNLDIMSEIVQENPLLKNVITKFLIPDYKENEMLVFLDYIDNIFIFKEHNNLPSGSKDPFGLKKQADFIINILLKNIIPIELPIQIEQWIRSRTEYILNNINPNLKLIKCNIGEISKYKNIKLPLEQLSRISNLVTKSEYTTNIELNNIETNLISQTVNLTNILTITDNIIIYIDNNKISPFIERKEILMNFLNQIKTLIHFS